MGDHRPRPTLRDEDEQDEEDDEVEEWTLSHYPPLVARWLLSCSWRGGASRDEVETATETESRDEEVHCFPHVHPLFDFLLCIAKC